MSHTIGPWEQSGLAVIAENRGIICGCPTPKTNGVVECMDNARLIAAAPDLYEACAHMRDQHAMLRTSCICIICEACKKAEGKE